MESLAANLHSRHQPLNLTINHNRPSFPKTLSSSISFKTPSQKSFKSTTTIKASSNHQNSNSLQTLTTSIIKSTCITITTAATLSFMSLHLSKPAFAAPQFVPVTTTTNTVDKETLPIDEQEKLIEQELDREPDNVDSLRSLMEIKIKSGKLPEAIEIIDRLIEVEKDEKEWPLLKAQIYSYSGDFENAKRGFEDILAKDPIRVEAYHGLVMTYSEAGDSLKDVEKRVQLAMEKCIKDKNLSDVRDFKLLLAQIRVMEGKHVEALKVYDELVNEEPRDFRPYLCKGIIFTLLKKNDEAEKQFDKFRRLVPKNHPYQEYFMDNMMATKLFSEKADREMGR
ncbi:hypothetical protein ACFE04_000839 [Oxalis oulophora]